MFYIFVLILFLLFLATPIIFLTLAVVNVIKFIYFKRKNKQMQGAYSSDEIRKVKGRMMIYALISVIFVIMVYRTVSALDAAISYM